MDADSGELIGADRPDLHGQVEGLVDSIGATLQRLHETRLPVPIEGEQCWDALRSAIEERLKQDLIQPDAMPDPYSRYEPAALVDIWVQGRPAIHDLALCHGNPRLAMFQFQGDTFVGCDDVSSVRVADRHLDLATMHQEIHHLYGPEAIYRFYEAYGSDPDLVKLDHYLLASHLLRTAQQ